MPEGEGIGQGEYENVNQANTTIAQDTGNQLLSGDAFSGSGAFGQMASYLSGSASPGDFQGWSAPTNQIQVGNQAVNWNALGMSAPTGPQTSYNAPAAQDVTTAQLGNFGYQANPQSYQFGSGPNDIVSAPGAYTPQQVNQSYDPNAAHNQAMQNLGDYQNFFQGVQSPVEQAMMDRSGRMIESGVNQAAAEMSGLGNLYSGAMQDAAARVGAETMADQAAQINQMNAEQIGQLANTGIAQQYGSNQFGANLGQQGQIANQGAGLQAGLAHNDQLLQAGLANQSAAVQAGLAGNANQISQNQIAAGLGTANQSNQLGYDQLGLNYDQLGASNQLASNQMQQTYDQMQLTNAQNNASMAQSAENANAANQLSYEQLGFNNAQMQNDFNLNNAQMQNSFNLGAAGQYGNIGSQVYGGQLQYGDPMLEYQQTAGDRIWDLGSTVLGGIAGGIGGGLGGAVGNVVGGLMNGGGGGQPQPQQAPVPNAPNAPFGSGFMYTPMQQQPMYGNTGWFGAQAQR